MNDLKSAWPAYARLQMELENYVAYVRTERSSGLLLIGKSGYPLLSDARFVASGLLDVTESDLDKNVDFFQVKTDKKSLTVDDAMEVLKNSSRLPSSADYIVVLIDGIDKFTDAGQDKLLKLMEEASNVVILATAYTGRVLNTIKSRMQILTYPTMTEAEFLDRYRTLSDADILFYITGGVPMELSPEQDDLTEVVAAFKGVKEAIKAKDKKKLFSSLNLVKEKDKNSFFEVYKQYVPAFLSFILRQRGIEWGDKLLEVLKEERNLSESVSYTSADFFSAIVQVAEAL